MNTKHLDSVLDGPPLLDDFVPPGTRKPIGETFLAPFRPVVFDKSATYQARYRKNRDGAAIPVFVPPSTALAAVFGVHHDITGNGIRCPGEPGSRKFAQPVNASPQRASHRIPAAFVQE